MASVKVMATCRNLFNMLLLTSGLLLLQGKCVSSQVESACPTWTYANSKDKDRECLCGSSIGGAVYCVSYTNFSAVNIKLKYFCIFYSEEFNNTLIGTCPYGSGGQVPTEVSELKNNKMCSYLHRKGQLCGQCEDNYTLPLYSYYLGCVKCKDYNYGWIKFIAIAFIPLTFFYIIVIVFRISATSSTLNGYVLCSQLWATPTMMHMVYTENLVGNGLYEVSPNTQLFVQCVIAFYSIWNLDFFRSFYEQICLYPNLTYQQVLMFDYAVAVYPLLLILITFILVKLHDNFAIVVWLWRPFHRYLFLFRKQWNIQSYLINAFATFIVLAYVKILNVSFEFLIMSHIYNIQGQSVSKAYWYYDGRVNMEAKEYLPYLLLSLLMMIIFNIFPLVLLALYPFKCFQRLLNSACFPCLRVKLALHIFMDAFQGCYEDNYRHFATLYLALRFINLLLLSVFSYYHYFSVVLFPLTITLALVAKFQPYKCKRSNTIDIFWLLLLVTGCNTRNTTLVGHGMTFPHWLSQVIYAIFVLISVSYILVIILARIIPCARKLCTKCKNYIFNRMTICNVDSEEQDLLDHNY